MRKLLIGLGILLLLAVVVVVIAVLNVNTYLEENRDQLTGLASDAAGRTVDFERAEVAFSGGLAVRVDGLRVAEDPGFGKADFLTLDEAFVGVRLLPALQQRIEVSGVRLVAPTIRVIQTKQGFNFSSLGQTADSAAEPPAEPPAEGAGFAVAIAALEISDGTIYYEDRTSKDGLSLVLEDFATSGTDLALDGPIAVDFGANVRSLRPPDRGLMTRLDGSAAIESLDTLAGTVRLESPTFHPAIFGFRFEEGKDAQVERLDDVRVDVVLPADPAKSGYTVAVRSGAARLAGYDLDDLSVDLNYRDPGVRGRGAEVDLERVAIGIADGLVELKGDVVLGEPGASPFELVTQIRDLDSGKLATQLLGTPAGALSGKLNGDVALAGDSLEWESLKRSLTGSVNLAMGKGALENVNLLDRLVNQLVAEPAFGQLVASSLRESAPEALSGDRTAFDGADLGLSIAGGKIRAEELSLEAGVFALKASGSVSLEGAVAGDGRIRFTPEVSARILKRADRLAPLLAKGDVVELPVRIGGSAGSPSLMPDVRELAARAQQGAREELRKQAEKKLGDVLFGKDRDEAGEPSEPGRADPKDLLRKGIGGFLGR